MLMNPEYLIQADEMTAGDLIQMLLHFDPDLKLVYANQEGGFHPIHGIKQLTLALNVNDEYWYGKHDYPCSVDPTELPKHKQELCLLLTK